MENMSEISWREYDPTLIGKEYDPSNIYELLSDMQSDDFPFDEPDAMNNWRDYGFIKKDVMNNDIIKILNISKINGDNLFLDCENGVNISCNIKKEKKFFELNGISYNNIDDLKDWLNNEGQDWFKDSEVLAHVTVNNYQTIASLLKAHIVWKKNEFYQQINENKKIYKAKIISKNNGGFLVDIEGVDAFLPGSLAAANKINNFDSYIGKEIKVMIEDYINDGKTFIVSNKKYISNILPEKIKKLDYHSKYTGIVTGTKPFGIFIEFDDIFTGLLHVSEMDSETHQLFTSKQIKVDDSIDFYIKAIEKKRKIILSKFENPDEMITIEDFQQHCEKTVQEGEVIGVKPIGAFIKFMFKETSFIGLLHHIEISKKNVNLSVGEKRTFYITKIYADEKKIFLKIPEKVNISKS